MELCQTSAQFCVPCMETGIGLQQPAPSLECSQHYFGLRAITDLSNQCRPWVNESSRVLQILTKMDISVLSWVIFGDAELLLQGLSICDSESVNGRLWPPWMSCYDFVLTWGFKPILAGSAAWCPAIHTGSTYLTRPSFFSDLPHLLASSQNRSEIPGEQKTAARHDCFS